MSFEELVEETMRAIAAVPRVEYDVVAAMACVTELLELDPECYRALTRGGEMYIGAADRLGVTAEEGRLRALGFFERAIAVRPELPDAYAGKALALLLLGRPADALAGAEQGLQLLDQLPESPTPPDVQPMLADALHKVKAIALFRLGRPEEGLAVMTETVSRYPQSAVMRAGIQPLMREVLKDHDRLN